MIIKRLSSFCGIGCGLVAAMETAHQLARSGEILEIQRENEKQESERRDARTQTNLSVSIAVSHRLEDKWRNLSWWLCCRDILTTCVVKWQSVGAGETTHGEAKSSFNVLPEMRKRMLHRQSVQRHSSNNGHECGIYFASGKSPHQLFSKCKCFFAPAETWVLIFFHNLFIEIIKATIYEGAVQQ